MNDVPATFDPDDPQYLDVPLVRFDHDAMTLEVLRGSLTERVRRTVFMALANRTPPPLVYGVLTTDDLADAPVATVAIGDAVTDDPRRELTLDFYNRLGIPFTRKLLGVAGGFSHMASQLRELADVGWTLHAATPESVTLHKTGGESVAAAESTRSPLRTLSKRRATLKLVDLMDLRATRDIWQLIGNLELTSGELSDLNREGWTLVDFDVDRVVIARPT